MRPIFHIVGEADWRAACEASSYAPASLRNEGFVHFSYRDQVAGTANLRYRDRHDLVVIEIDPARLALPVVEEDLYGAGQLFPHIYGAIPTAAAVAEHRMRRDGAGNHIFAAA